ncbi:hypothetical protein ABZ154_09120 [Streptomyces sp. NPDC006261]|uniref:hypothetical protein n=1 Tax=Streptomyces sp. NPDC006261 TaxID=3156739 RepID=UPI0033A36018
MLLLTEQQKDLFREMDIDHLKSWIVAEMWNNKANFLTTADYEWIAEELIEKAVNL